MKRIIRYATALLMLLVFMTGAVFAGVQSDKRQINFINSNLKKRLKLIRNQLRAKKYSLATKNINQTTRSLRDIARYTKQIRKSEPGYVPNPPVNFDNTPAKRRRNEYKKARTMAINTAKVLNKHYQQANQALLRAKKRQLATIAITALKFTIENAPGQTGGKISSVIVEGTKKFNSYLMDKYIAQPITGTTEVKMIKKNFVSIRDGERLMKRLDKTRDKVMKFAREMDNEMKKLDGAVNAEKKWQKYRWLKEAGAGKITVRIVDYKSRDLDLYIQNTKLKPSMKGKMFTINGLINVTARMNGKRRKFVLQKKEAAKRMKTIRVHKGPGGGPSDSLVYSSARLPAKSSWLIKKESFTWKPSFNSSLEKDPRAVKWAYWDLKNNSMLWSIRGEKGEKANIFVKGKINWEFTRNIRGKITKKKETNDGSATLVVEIQ